MQKIVKNVARQVGGLVQDTGEAIVKEPLEIGKTAAKQTAGFELAPSPEEHQPLSPPPAGKGEGVTRLYEEEQQRQKDLSFYRRQLEQLKQETAKVRQEQARSGWEQDQEQAAIKQAKIRLSPSALVSAPGGKSKRGTALIGSRMKKNRQAGFEMGGQAAKRST